ncbi:unnamed protein product, partial [Anisakis simplex]|uniref:CSPG2 protein n=1 Tax=Anisakis simplex TaxID=6269 RepID=A0A0M3J121_ANISI
MESGELTTPLDEEPFRKTLATEEHLSFKPVGTSVSQIPSWSSSTESSLSGEAGRAGTLETVEPNGMGFREFFHQSTVETPHQFSAIDSSGEAFATAEPKTTEGGASEMSTATDLSASEGFSTLSEEPSTAQHFSTDFAEGTHFSTLEEMTSTQSVIDTSGSIDTITMPSSSVSPVSDLQSIYTIGSLNSAIPERPGEDISSTVAEAATFASNLDEQVLTEKVEQGWMTSVTEAGTATETVESISTKSFDETTTATTTTWAPEPAGASTGSSGSTEVSTESTESTGSTRSTTEASVTTTELSLAEPVHEKSVKLPESVSVVEPSSDNEDGREEDDENASERGESPTADDYDLSETTTTSSPVTTPADFESSSTTQSPAPKIIDLGPVSIDISTGATEEGAEEKVKLLGTQQATAPQGTAVTSDLFEDGSELKETSTAGHTIAEEQTTESTPSMSAHEIEDGKISESPEEVVTSGTLTSSSGFDDATAGTRPETTAFEGSAEETGTKIMKTGLGGSAFHQSTTSESPTLSASDSSGEAAFVTEKPETTEVGTLAGSGGTEVQEVGESTTLPYEEEEAFRKTVLTPTKHLNSFLRPAGTGLVGSLAQVPSWNHSTTLLTTPTEDGEASAAAAEIWSTTPESKSIYSGESAETGTPLAAEDEEGEKEINEEAFRKISATQQHAASKSSTIENSWPVDRQSAATTDSPAGDLLTSSSSSLILTKTTESESASSSKADGTFDAFPVSDLIEKLSDTLQEEAQQLEGNGSSSEPFSKVNLQFNEGPLHINDTRDTLQEEAQQLEGNGSSPEHFSKVNLQFNEGPLHINDTLAIGNGSLKTTFSEQLIGAGPTTEPPVQAISDLVNALAENTHLDQLLGFAASAANKLMTWGTNATTTTTNNTMKTTTTTTATAHQHSNSLAFQSDSEPLSRRLDSETNEKLPSESESASPPSSTVEPTLEISKFTATQEQETSSKSPSGTGTGAGTSSDTSGTPMETLESAVEQEISNTTTELEEEAIKIIDSVKHHFGLMLPAGTSRNPPSTSETTSAEPSKFETADNDTDGMKVTSSTAIQSDQSDTAENSIDLTTPSTDRIGSGKSDHLGS